MFSTQFKHLSTAKCIYGLSEYPTGVAEVSAIVLGDGCRDHFEGKTEVNDG